jgi:hypothetical protein
MNYAFSDRFPGYQHMTELPRELEEALLRRSRVDLCKWLTKKTKVIDTDTRYTAVQLIVKEAEYTEAQIRAFLAETPEAPDFVEPAPVFQAAPKPQAPAPAPAPAPVPKVKAEKVPNPKLHPQPIINAKTAIAREHGGAIGYDRGSKGWLVRKGTETEIWSADKFREMSLTDVKNHFSK